MHQIIEVAKALLSLAVVVAIPAAVGVLMLGYAKYEQRMLGGVKR